MAKVLRTLSHPDFSTKGIPLTKEEADQDLIEIWNEAESALDPSDLTDQSFDLDVNSISVNGTNLFPNNDPQDLGIGDDVEFESIDISGSSFVDSSRNVSASSVVIANTSGDFFKAQITDDSQSRPLRFNDSNNNRMGSWVVDGLDGAGAGFIYFDDFDYVEFKQNTLHVQQYFNATTGDKISLFGDRLGDANMYGLGIEGSGTYFKSNRDYYWYSGTNADDGTSAIMSLADDGALTLTDTLTINSQLLFTPNEEQLLSKDAEPEFNNVTINSQDVATELWVNSNFDNYQLWSAEADGNSTNIGSTDTLNFIGGSDILTSVNIENQELTISLDGSLYSSWDALDGDGGNIIVGSGTDVTFAGVNGVETTVSSGQVINFSLASDVIRDDDNISRLTNDEGYVTDPYSFWNASDGTSSTAVGSEDTLSFLGGSDLTTTIDAQNNELTIAFDGTLYSSWDALDGDGGNIIVGSGTDVTFAGVSGVVTTVVSGQTINFSLESDVIRDDDNISRLTNNEGYITSAPVDSVFGRTGAVTAEAGDYSDYYDNYEQWHVSDNSNQTGIGGSQVLTLLGDSSIDISVNVANNEVQFTFSGSTGSYQSWDATADDENTIVVNDGDTVDFAGGGGINTSNPVGNQVAISIDNTVITSGDNISRLTNNENYVSTGDDVSFGGGTFSGTVDFNGLARFNSTGGANCAEFDDHLKMRHTSAVIRTAGSGSSTFRIYDDNGNFAISQFSEGGNVDVPNGVHSALDHDESSDIRIKDKLASLDPLKIAEYAKDGIYSYEKEGLGRRQIGLIAQYMDDAHKDLVHWKNDYKGYDRFGMLSAYSVASVALAGVGQVDSKLKQLKKRVNELEEEVKNLR